ncbi:MAG: glycogen/starch synthase, partial [Nitrospinota bacterium]
MAPKKLNVLFAASEIAPFIKTGGLADVASALPRALSALGQNVIAILPLYGSISLKGLKKTGITVRVEMDGRTYSSAIFEGKLDRKTKIYFLHQPALYGRPNPYGEGNVDYHDNDARFVFFNRAVFSFLRKLNFRPDVIHANDWQCGLMPAYLKNTDDGFFEKTASVFSIHSLAYQGLFPKKSMSLTGLPKKLFGPEGLEIYGKLGMLKSGVVFADAVTAVSPTYAKEILTPDLGFGMQDVLGKRKKSLYGILNGIDTKEWNPATDRHIPANYSRKKLGGKAKCRAAFLKKAGLGNDLQKPLIGIVSRLIEQKGFDIVAAASEKIMKDDFYLAALGTGQP